MKKVIFPIILLVLLVSCEKDFLDRYPLSEISPENSFSTAEDLELYTNSFYQDLPGVSGIIEQDNKSDNVLYGGVPSEQTGERIVPGDAGAGGWSWGDLRKINMFFKYYHQCDDEEARKEYSGVAYFFRAWFYYNKLVRFGAVPYYSEVVGSADEDLLFKARDSRVTVVDSMIRDLDMAIENLNVNKSSDRVNKWTALALKSRLCLFEGTFRKYHSELNLPGADELLQHAADAAYEVIINGPYSLYQTGDINTVYRDLFASENAIEDEIILTRRYSEDLNVVQSVNYYLTSPTQDDISLTKSIINDYLKDDGSRFTDVAGYEQMPFAEEVVDRDPRLSQTIRSVGYKRIGNSEELVPDFDAAISGYQITKFLADESQDGFEASYQDLPIIRFAEVLLNYAEAMAELGTLTQEDLDLSINLLRTRVGMPGIDLALANANPDPLLASRYISVNGSNAGVIYEIRRERRVELVLEGFRYNDLMRWKAGKLLEEHFAGMYFPGLGEYDLDGNGSIDLLLYSGAKPESPAPQSVEIGSLIELSEGNSGNLVPFASRTKLFDESVDYLYPIPLGDLLLNENLQQNPGWGNR